jgi:hypothetical protein
MDGSDAARVQRGLTARPHQISAGLLAIVGAIFHAFCWTVLLVLPYFPLIGKRHRQKRVVTDRRVWVRRSFRQGRRFVPSVAAAFVGPPDEDPTVLDSAILQRARARAQFEGEAPAPRSRAGEPCSGMPRPISARSASSTHSITKKIMGSLSGVHAGIDH